MSIRLVGELLTPISCPMAGVTIHLKALDTSASVLFSSEASVKTDYKGRYEFTVPTGLYLVSLDNGISQAELGQIQVYSDSTESTLQALLDAPKTEPSPIWLQQLEEKVAEATRQAGIATNAATEATTAAKTVKDNVDAAKQHADRAYASATNAAKSEASASADAVSAEESAVRAEEAASISQSLGVVNPNLFINGCFSEWNRGIRFDLSTSTGSIAVADRWVIHAAGDACVVNKETWNKGNDPKFDYILIVPSIDNGLIGISQTVENAAVMAGKKLTVSFDVNSNVSETYNVMAYWVGKSITVSEVVVGKSNFGWSRLSHTFTVPARSADDQHLVVRINKISGSNERFRFGNIKLEEGSIATQCIHDKPSVNTAKCQSYTRKMTFRETTISSWANGVASITCNFPPMRSAPAIIGTDSLQTYEIGGSYSSPTYTEVTGAIRTITDHSITWSIQTRKTVQLSVYLKDVILDAEI